MTKMYSVKLLFESTTKPQFTAWKIFEERIILVQTISKEEIAPIINQEFPVERYENSEGGWTTVKLVAVLDVFELVDSIDGACHLKEVYSRYLYLDGERSADDVIQRFSLDQ